jgi:hypothetical protein
MASNAKSSDNLLLILAIVAVAVSVIGVILSMSGGFITGHATTATGNVNLTVSQNMAIRMVIDNIGFGSGQITAGNAVVLESNFTDGLVVMGSGTFNRSLPANNGDGRKTGGLIIENNGNVPVTTLTVSGGAGYALADFICGGVASPCWTAPTPVAFPGGQGAQFQLAAKDNITGSCQTYSAGLFANQAWVNVTNGAQTICTTFKDSTTGPPATNRIEVHARIRMPENTPATYKNNVLTFQAS